MRYRFSRVRPIRGSAVDAELPLPVVVVTAVVLSLRARLRFYGWRFF
jgi:hypothetical protein